MVTEIHSFTRKVIEDRRKTKLSRLSDATQLSNSDEEFGIKKRRALLDILLDSTIDGQPLSNGDIQEEAENFMFAGHDTTTSAIEFLLFNLANHPDVQQRVYEEIVQVLGVDAADPVTLTKLNDLNYLEIVMKESLRLYPSVPLIGRYIREDITVSEYYRLLYSKSGT